MDQNRLEILKDTLENLKDRLVDLEEETADGGLLID